VRAWRDLAHDHAEKHGNAVRRENQDAWDAKVRAELLKGTGWAHRVTKPPDIPAPPNIGEGGNTSLCFQLQAQVDIWRQWWKVDAGIPPVTCTPHL
jgi:hypothetical protein